MFRCFLPYGGRCGRELFLLTGRSRCQLSQSELCHGPFTKQDLSTESLLKTRFQCEAFRVYQWNEISRIEVKMRFFNCGGNFSL